MSNHRFHDEGGIAVRRAKAQSQSTAPSHRATEQEAHLFRVHRSNHGLHGTSVHGRRRAGAQEPGRVVRGDSFQGEPRRSTSGGRYRTWPCCQSTRRTALPRDLAHGALTRTAFSGRRSIANPGARSASQLATSLSAAALPGGCPRTASFVESASERALSTSTQLPPAARYEAPAPALA